MRRVQYLSSLATPRFDPLGRTRRSGVEPGPGLDMMPPRASRRVPGPIGPEVNPFQLVWDPVTLEYIEVGSALFQRRVNPIQGAPDSVAPFVYNEQTLQLVLQWDRILFVIREIEYDSVVEERNTDITIQGVDTRLIVLRIIDAALDLEEVPFRNQFENLRNRMLEFTDEPQMVTMMVGFEYHGVHVNPNGFLAGSNSPAVGTAQETDPVFQQQALGADKALRIPFSNVDWNDGDDDKCVDRFLGLDLDPMPLARTVRGMTELAALYGFGLKLYDVLGGIMSERLQLPGDDSTDQYRGIVFNRHLYPIKDLREPALILKPTVRYQSHDDVYNTMHETGSALYRINDTYYVNGVGLMRMAKSVFEDWMGDLLMVLRPSHGWDPATMTIIKQASMPAIYDAPCVADGLDESHFVAFDASKCYYHAFRYYMKSSTAVVGVPSVFERFRPLRDGERVPKEDHYYYMIEIESDLWRPRLGLLRNVVLGMTRRVLEAFGVPIRVTHVLEIQSRASLGEATRKKVLEMIDGWDDVQKKKYAIVNGIMGRVARVKTYQFRVNNEIEANYYVEQYNASRQGDTILVERDSFEVVNKVHWHSAVIHTATTAILHHALRIHRGTGKWPVRIKVDSLTYRIRDFQSPFDRSGMEYLDRVFEIPMFTGAPWHREPITDPPAYIAPPSYRRLEVGAAEQYANITYMGPPGVGKTHKALHDHAVDLSVCFSNKGARRVGGKTIHSALGLWGEHGVPTLDQLRNKLIFIDEFQSVPRRLIAHCVRAYHEVGARFIFAMDVNQLPPVGEYPLKPYGSPFLGNVVELTHEWRNDAELVAARRGILTHPCTFRPPLQPVTVDAAGVAHFDINPDAMCIAYRRQVCKRVNERMVQIKGINFGDEQGRYIASKPHRKTGVLQSELLKRRGNRWVRSDGTTFEWPLERAKKFIDWGFCVTIHKMIGETVDGPLAIFDWDFIGMDRFIKYTAVTRAKRLADVTFYPSFRVPPSRKRAET